MRNLIYLNSIILFILLPIFLYAQQILDQMQLVDISNEASIRSSVIRDPEQALLIVKTQIAGLRVESNNEIIRNQEVEPGTRHIRLKPGTHRLSFQADGFISVQERFFFNPKDVKGLNIRVIPAAEKKEEKNTGIIVIKSTPDSAAVYLNDQFYGMTPYLGKTLAGQYKLQLKKAPYLDHEQRIIMIAGETLPINIELGRGLGSVAISSDPPNAQVEINDRKIGKTPLTFNKLAKGTHRLKISLNNYSDYVTEFEINEQSRTASLNAILSAKESQLSVQGFPANASVYIDAVYSGSVPLSTAKMKYGIREIVIKKPGYFNHEENLLVDKSETYLLDIRLKAKNKYSALLYSTLLPGSGQFYSGRPTQGYIFAGAAAAGLAGSIYFYSDYQSEKDQYNQDKAAYDNNTDLGEMDRLYQTKQESYKTMEDAHKTSQIMFGVTAAVWILNMADAIIFFPSQSGMYIEPRASSRKSV